MLSRGRVGRWDGAGVMLPESFAAGPADLRAAFGNSRPAEVEIGSGKGTFLLARAAARPEVNFLGIEWARAYCLYAADRLRRARLPNVRMLRADAAAFFRSCLPDACLLRVHIYFPDPWPKQRHHRRRIIQPRFLVDARRTLQPGGQLIVVTDHLDYFRQIRQLLTDFPGLATTPMPRMADKAGELVGTNFERKYIAQGRAFFSLARMRHI